MSSRVSPGQEFALGLAGRKEFENELDGQARPANHWYTSGDSGLLSQGFVRPSPEGAQGGGTADASRRFPRRKFPPTGRRPIST